MQSYGMLTSDLIAIFLGKLLNSKISEKTMQKISGILFLIFGIIGFISWFSYNYAVKYYV